MKNFAIPIALASSVITVVYLTTIHFGEEQRAYRECRDEILRKLNAPSSFSYVSSSLGVRKSVPPAELSKKDSYRFLKKSVSPERVQRDKEDGFFLQSWHDYGIERLKQWEAKSSSGELWQVNVYVEFDAQNNFGAVLRRNAKCEVIWYGSSLRDALATSRVFDPKKAEVDLTAIW